MPCRLLLLWVLLKLRHIRGYCCLRLMLLVLHGFQRWSHSCMMQLHLMLLLLLRLLLSLRYSRGCSMSFCLEMLLLLMGASCHPRLGDSIAAVQMGSVRIMRICKACVQQLLERG